MHYQSSRTPNTRRRKASQRHELITLTQSQASLHMSADSQIPDNAEQLPEGIVAVCPQQLFSNMSSPLSEIYRCLKRQVCYQDLSISEIQNEKRELEQFVRYLNSQINILVSSTEKARLLRLQKVSKKSHSKFQELDAYQSEKQVENNGKLITNMLNEYRYLKHRLATFEHPGIKLKYDKKISKVRQGLQQEKLLLIEKKRKNHLGEKKIVQLGNRQSHKQYFDLQQEYVAFCKKKEQYQKKLDQIMEENAKLAVSSENIEDKYCHIADQAKQIKKEIKEIDNYEHNRLMYETSKRKLQLALKKRQREQEIYKKKYYELLREYEKIVDRNTNNDEKIIELTARNNSKISHLFHKESQISSPSKNTETQNNIRYWTSDHPKTDEEEGHINHSVQSSDGSHEGNGATFMLTELQQKITSRKPDYEKQTKPDCEKQTHVEDDKTFHKESKSKSVFQIRKTGKKMLASRPLYTESSAQVSSASKRNIKYNSQYKFQPKKSFLPLFTENSQSVPRDSAQSSVYIMRMQTEQIEPLVRKRKRNKKVHSMAKQNKGQQQEQEEEYNDDFEDISKPASPCKPDIPQQIVDSS